jgi:hypothetical protein
MVKMETSQAFQGWRSTEKGSFPPGLVLSGVPLMERPLPLWCKSPDPSPSCLYPLMGSQHPSGGLFSPMEVRTGHLPMCTGPNGTCPSGMVLHIKSYALHGLISHRDHSNVNHISSSILLNICIKTLIHQSIAQRHYKNLQYKIGEKDKTSYWASVHKKRKVSRKISSKPCK